MEVNYLPGTQSPWSWRRRPARRSSQGSPRPPSWSSNPSCNQKLYLCLPYLCHLRCSTFFVPQLDQIRYLWSCHIYPYHLAPSALLMLKETSAEDVVTAGAGSGLPCLVCLHLDDHLDDMITLNRLMIFDWQAIKRLDMITEDIQKTRNMFCNIIHGVFCCCIDAGCKDSDGDNVGGLEALVVIRPQRSQEFQSETGWDEIFSKSQDPEICRDGIDLIFSYWDRWDPGIFGTGSA